jgi:hypothetical protein
VLRRRSVVAGLVAAVALVGGAYATAGSGSSRQAPTTEKVIASTTTSDYRVVVTAEKHGPGSAPEAALTATTFKRRPGGWERIREHRLSGTYFWKTVSGQKAVCRLEIRTAGTRPGFRPRATVQLLLTPSLGCAPTANLALGR